MKVLALNEEEKYILKGVIEGIEPSKIVETIFSYLEWQMSLENENTSLEEQMMFDTISELYGKMVEFDSDEELKEQLLKQDYKSIFDEEKKNPLTVGQQTKNHKEELQETL